MGCGPLIDSLNFCTVRNYLREKASRLHYAVTALLGVALFPALHWLRLPVEFDWRRLAIGYWLVLAAQAVFVAVLLLVVNSPSVATRNLLRRFRANRWFLVLVVIYFGALVIALNWGKAIVLTVDTAAVLEFRDRAKNHSWSRTLGTVLAPALYLFVGFLIVFGYNDVILSLRFFGSADAALNSIDRFLMGGFSVAQLCAWAAGKLPVYAYHFLEFIYFGMFSEIGAAMLLLSVYAGRKSGLRFVGTILVAYYVALLLFYAWPSQGPYYLSGGSIPGVVFSRTVQKQSLINSVALWQHKKITWISTDYYIAFPCMHIAQPLIAMWFLRRSRRIFVALSIYNTLLLAAIVLLEWHYLVDILSGVLVAGIAIALVNFDDWGKDHAPACSLSQ